MKNQNCMLSPVTRKRLEQQGYVSFTDAQLNDFKFGIRFAYYLCGLLVLTGLVFSRIEILIIAMVVAFFAMLPPYHPIDYLYNYGVRQVLHKPKLPPRTSQGRFACGIATIWLGAIIVLLGEGLHVYAYVAGGVLLIVATLVSTLDICIPSILYNFLFTRHVPGAHSEKKIHHGQEGI
jgi:hypothetical protein